MSAPLSHILRFWDKNKAPLFQLFGNKLILEKEIDIKRPAAILEEDMEEALYPNGKAITFIQSFNTWIDPYIREDWLKYDDVRTLIDIENLCDNIYINDPVEIPTPNDKHPLQIQKGCKVMKMLSKIAKTFNLEGFEEFRIKHSMVLNQKRFKGTLCLSIHPLDYMTMSDNNCNWDSCMSWKNVGEYRLGTVEMMNSPYVIVAYVKSDKDMVLYNNPKAYWNSKRWRELFVVSPEIITAIKGYPFCDNNLRDLVFDWILDLNKKNGNNRYYPTKYEDIRNGSVVKVVGLEIIPHLEFHAMYNDYYGSHPGYFGHVVFSHGDAFTIMVSGETECMKCGDDWTEIYKDFDTESLICPECSGVRKCPECGEYTEIDSWVYLDDDTGMCTWCADRYAERCTNCGDLFRENNVTEVFLRHIGVMDRDTSIHLCDDCMESPEVTRMIGEIKIKAARKTSFFWNPTFYQADTKNFTPEGFHLFGIWGGEVENMLEEIAEAGEENDD